MTGFYVCFSSFMHLLPPASYTDRVHIVPSGIAFTQATRKDSGIYTCMVSDEGGSKYAETNIELIVLGAYPLICTTILHSVSSARDGYPVKSHLPGGSVGTPPTIPT